MLVDDSFRDPKDNGGFPSSHPGRAMGGSNLTKLNLA